MKDEIERNEEYKKGYEDGYEKGYTDGFYAPKIGSEVMRSNGDKGVITHVDRVKKTVYILWSDGRASYDNIDSYPPTFRTHDIRRILRELKEGEQQYESVTKFMKIGGEM